MSAFPHQRHARYGQPHLPHLALRLKFSCQINQIKACKLMPYDDSIMNYCSDMLCLRMCHVIYNA
jgi:hypothetical protein